MKAYVNSTILANLVSMLRADVDGAIWLIDDDREGRFYEKCAHPSSRVVNSQGVALELLDIVQGRGTAGVVAAIRGSRYRSQENVFLPSLGDVASILLVSESWDRVLEEVTGGSWHKASEKEIGPLSDRSVKIAWLVERLLLPGMLEELERFIDWNSLDLSPQAINEVLGVEAVERLNVLLAEVNLRESRDLLAGCDGMNAIRVAASATRYFRPRGLQAETAVDAETLLAMLRVAFNLEELERDPVFWQMRRWERRNHRYALLRGWRLLDPLQSLWDQRYWDKDLKHLTEASTDMEGLVAFKVDLDNFKQINDRLGHDEGDDAIRVFCGAVRETLQEVAEIYRRGGDEVVALAPGLDGREGIRLAEELRHRVESTFRLWGKDKEIELYPTASIGVVEAAPGTSSREVISSMDEAQRRAKHEGKNRVVFIRCGDDSSARIEERAFLEG